MEELLKKKLEAAMEMKNFTEEIRSLSPKTDYDKINSMLDERQVRIENINAINEEIKKKEELYSKFGEFGKFDYLKKEIREVFKETAEIDNLIRKNLNDELKNVKSILNQPEEPTRLINIKA
ncbi:MAG TPA: hypothetical protein DC038_09425 [Clostridiales bacterium]|nr:hypothetical protein [Clostridiales bacterium]